MKDIVNRLGDVYRGSRVLITGHTGFKGGWLVLLLRRLGAEVIGYALEPPSSPSFFQAAGLENEITHIHGDVRDLHQIKRIIEQYHPTFVFHLAAQSLVRLSYKEPHLTYETNVMGTVNVLEAVRSAKSVQVTVIVTSDKCYANQEMVWGYRENDPLGGQDPYSSSKGCAELITYAYQRSYFPLNNYGSEHKLALASVRAGNVIGGGDWGADRLVPDCVRALSRGEAIVIRSPHSVRPWQHVLEPLVGYLLLGARLRQDGPSLSGAWNFGPMDSELWCVEDMVKEIINLWEEGSFLVDNNTKLPETHFLKLDCSKASQRLGWRPKYSLRNALKKTISWYKKYYHGANTASLQKYTRQQIDSYLYS